MKNSLPALEFNQLSRGQSSDLVEMRFKMGRMMPRSEVVKQFSRLSHQGNLKEATSLLLREIFCEFVMNLRFPFCQRDPCLLPIFLLCQIEDFHFAFYLSFDFVTLILRPVYFLHSNNKAMSNTHSCVSKISQNIPVTTLH